ncbi:MAG TPA: glycosyltransferase family 87 protein, partial [Micromonosporaceae bacterium]|nr:glycosyltransferase family 87 protein [Micromonosporaceae bacterium]
VAAALAALQMLAGGRLRGGSFRWFVVAVCWLGGTVVPLLVQAVQRAGGNLYRAQEEVAVIELGAARLLSDGTPYLTRDAIAAAPEPLLAYLPYQPGMVVLGLPRALAGSQWWTDARVWFALATAAALALALRQLKAAGRPDPLLVRAAQAVTVLPICALTLATGGDDLPVLALCLLAVVLARRGRWPASGIAVGTAAALKLFAWPVAVVLMIHAFGRGSGPARRLVVPALGIPGLVLLPVALADRAAVWENLVRFPLGLGLVASPAASPLPGHLIATSLPGGRGLAAGLLVVAAVGLAAWTWWRPPGTARAAAGLCAVGLLIAILLMPATRFGYLLYPAGFAVWAVAVGGLAGTGHPSVPSKVA